MQDRGCRVAALVALALAALGCGPAEVIEPPGGWPPQWSGRKIYATPLAIIYASSDSAAGQADQAVRSAAAEYRKRTGRVPPRGVVIITDAGDEPIASDAARASRLVAQARRRRMGSVEPFAEQDARELAERIPRQPMEGFDPMRVLQTQPMAFTASQLVEMGLPAAPEAWGAGLPTDDLLWRLMHSMMETRLKTAGLGQRTMMGAMMPMMRSKIRAATAAARELTVFCEFVARDGELGDEEKRSLIEEVQRLRTP
jgi:hypothetical protein